MLNALLYCNKGTLFEIRNLLRLHLIHKKYGILFPLVYLSLTPPEDNLLSAAVIEAAARKR